MRNACIGVQNLSRMKIDFIYLQNAISPSNNLPLPFLRIVGHRPPWLLGLTGVPLTVRHLPE